MYWPLTVLSMALLWLLHRLYVLIKVHPTDLVKALKIEIPRASKLSIDNITDSALYLHWDLPSLNDEIVSFMLFINEKETSTLNGTDSHCYLSGLNPGTKYKIDLISINSKGFKAKSQSIYIKTKSKELQNHSNRILLESADNLYSFLTGKTESTFNVKKFLATAVTSGDVRAARSRSNTVNSLSGKDLDTENGNILPSNASIHTTTTVLPDPKSIEDIEELRYYLESGQEELHTVLNQQTAALREFKELEMNLIQERDALRERKRLEDTNRQTTKNESKLLDDSRRRTELKRIKQEAALASKRKYIEKMRNDLSSWNIKLEEFEKSKIDMENSENMLHTKMDTDIIKNKELVRKLQSELSKLEEEFKSTNQKKKQFEQAKPSYIKIFKRLSSGTNNTTGCVSAEGLKSLETLKDLNPDLHSKIQNEIHEDARLEAEWRAQQQREVSHCAKASQAYDILKTQNNNLKNGVWTSSNTESISPPHGSAVTVPHSVSYVNNENLKFKATSSLSTHNLNYFSGSSPSVNSLPQHLINQPQSQPQTSSSFNQINSMWNVFNPERSSSNNLTLSTNGADIFTNENSIDSPSVNHFLPANLIVDDLADFMYQGPTQSQAQAQSQSQSQAQAQTHTPKSSHFEFPLDHINGNGFSNINTTQMNFTTSQEFTLSPQFNIGTPASPAQSFQNNEFLSANNSPSGGHTNNELHNVLSGGTEMVTNSNPSAISTSQGIGDLKENNFNPFSPRRLSNVFNFGKNKMTEEQSQSQSQSTSINQVKQQSKFFNSNLDVSKSNSSVQGKFSFHRNGNQANNSKFFSNFDTVWQDLSANNAHGRSVPVNSTSSLEKDSDSWYRFHTKSPEIAASPEMASSPDTNDHLIAPVSLIEINKSSNSTSMKSVKSTKLPIETNNSSSSFFKKKFPFVGNNEKSPTKNNSLHSTISQSGDTIEEEGFDDQQQTQQTQKKLFSRTRKSSNSNIRKQSVPSSTDYEMENSSIQSSSTNGRSIVRKLNIFGKSTNKEINEDVIDENVGAENVFYYEK